MELKDKEAFIYQLLQDLMDMEESTNYQAILGRGLQRKEQQALQQGRVTEARAISESGRHFCRSLSNVITHLQLSHHSV
jgi:predicted transposase YdaD